MIHTENKFKFGFITTLLFSTVLIYFSAVEFLLCLKKLVFWFLGKFMKFKLIKNLLACYFGLVISLKINAIQYLYPVEICNNQVYYIQQKGLADLELWRYFIDTGQQEKCLDWRYVPAGFKILPNKKNFSFIDSGRLRIKDFAKRSSHAIEFDTPVHGLYELNWIDSQVCYFSAKQKDHYAIFYGDIKTKKLTSVYCDLGSECLSPSLVENQLFFIERNNLDRSSKIVKLNLEHAPELVLDCNYGQLIYLKMLNPELGFYIEHMPYLNDKSELIGLVCHKIEFCADLKKWVGTKLFKFSILKKYLFGSERLYESIIPFLPRAKKTCLYFSDMQKKTDGQYCTSIFGYDLINLKIIDILQSDSKNLFFAPLGYQEGFFYGQISESQDDLFLKFSTKACPKLVA
jgi:hypothetical protein